MFGKLIHFGFDALLISALLAGIKRTTGLTYGFGPLLGWQHDDLTGIPHRPKLSSVPNKDVRSEKVYLVSFAFANFKLDMLSSYLELGTEPFYLDVGTASSSHPRGIYFRHGRGGTWGTNFRVLQYGVAHQARKQRSDSFERRR